MAPAEAQQPGQNKYLMEDAPHFGAALTPSSPTLNPGTIQQSSGRTMMSVFRMTFFFLHGNGAPIPILQRTEIRAGIQYFWTEKELLRLISENLPPSKKMGKETHPFSAQG